MDQSVFLQLNARNTIVEQRMIANGVFATLNEAWKRVSTVILTHLVECYIINHQNVIFFFLPSYMTDTRFRSKLGGCDTDDSLTFGLNDHKETRYRAHVNPGWVFIMVHT